MGLVDDGALERPLDRPVALPVVAPEIDDDALHGRHAVGGIAGFGSSIAGGGGHPTPVRIEQDRAGVEAQPVDGRPWPVGAVRVVLAGTDPGHVDVPVRAGPVAIAVQVDDTRRCEVVRAIEQQQVDRCGPLGIDDEVHPAVDDGRAETVVRSRRQARRARGVRVGRQVGSPTPGVRVLRQVGHPCRRGHRYRPTLACIIPPSATNVVAVL